MIEFLTKDTFKEKVFNFEQSKEWKFEGELPCVIDFYADWCVSCKEMERDTFSAASVQSRLSGMVTLQADVTQNLDAHKALLKRFDLFGPPGIVFFDRRGEEVKGLRVVGFQPADRFAATLDTVLR